MQVPIHIMYQPDFLTARVMALEDVEVYVEDVEFARVLCEETMAVKREAPMQVTPILAERDFCLKAFHSSRTI